MNPRAPLLAVTLSAVLLLPGCAGRARPFPGPPSPPPSTAPRPAPRGEGTWHVVRRGETLWRIARRYGVTVEAIARANGIDDPSRLRAGQRIFIPGARGKAGPDTGRRSPGQAQPPSRRADWRWPLDGPVTSAFGAPRAHGRRAHTGIDIAAPRGTPVRASRAGRVTFAGRRAGYGRLVVLDHGRGFSSWYAHLSRILVRTGQHVRAGDIIGGVGTSGNTTGPHLHFEIRRRGHPLDPLVFLP